MITKNHLSQIEWEHFNKYIAARVFPNYERYLFVDADTLPGKKFKIDDFFCNDYISVCRDTFGIQWIMSSLEFFSEVIPSSNYNLDNYFNSGVIAYQTNFLPKLDEMLSYMEENYNKINSVYLKAKEANRAIGRDQTLLNLYSFINKWNIKYLEPHFNLQFPLMRGKIDYLISKSAIIHFNGTGRKGLREYISKF